MARLKNSSLQNAVPSRKRKSPEAVLDVERRPSPFDRRLQQNSRTPSASRSSSVSSSIQPPPHTSTDVYNGVIDKDEDGFMFCRPVSATMLFAKSLLTHVAKQPGRRSSPYHRRTLTRNKTSRVPGGGPDRLYTSSCRICSEVTKSAWQINRALQHCRCLNSLAPLSIYCPARIVRRSLPV